MTVETGYWRSILRQRISRRRALQAAALGGAGLAGATVIACGGEEEEEAAATPTTPTAAEEEPLLGGVLRGTGTADPLSFDPQKNLSFATDVASGATYSRLYKFKTAPGYDATNYDPVPDAAESFEATPDLLTWTFKLRPDVRFHDVPPVNGRLLVAEDVAATYERFVNLPARFKQSLAMVERVETPDDRTVVFHLNIPYPHFLTTIASPSYLWLLSREAAAGEIDPATEWIGTGPFVRERFEPSKESFLAKHPEYFLSPLPYVDGIRTAIVPEHAQQVAQFIAGNTDTQFIDSLDLEAILTSVPGVQLIGDEGNVVNLLNFFYFSGIDPESPFKDERVRRAASMAIDRDALFEVVYNISVNERLGVRREKRWHNIVPAGLSKWWLDPRGDEIGEAGRWYQFDPAESKRLLSSAGYEDGLPAELHFTTAIYAFTGYDTAAEAIIPMLNEAGFKVQPKVEDYLAEYITKTFLGDFKDMAFGLETIFTEVDEYLFNMLHPDGNRNHGKIDDPELTRMIEAQRLEPDPDRRKQIIDDIQRYVSDRMYYVPLVIGGTSQFVVAQPWVGNFGNYNTASFGITTESTMHLFRRT